MSKEIIDWLDSDAGWDDIIFEIKERCRLEDAEYIAMKIVRDFGYRRQNPYVPNPSVYYEVIDNTTLYDFLDDFIQCEDCKNGCQLMQEDDGTHFFQITGQCFSDARTDKIVGCDTVKIYFKEFVW